MSGQDSQTDHATRDCRVLDGKIPFRPALPPSPLLRQFDCERTTSFQRSRRVNKAPRSVQQLVCLSKLSRNIPGCIGDNDVNIHLNALTWVDSGAIAVVRSSFR